MSLLARIVMAVIVAVIVTLACMLIGAILIAVRVDVAVAVGQFLKDWASVFGLLAGLWHFFSGSSWPRIAQ